MPEMRSGMKRDDYFYLFWLTLISSFRKSGKEDATGAGQQVEDENYLQNELASLNIEPKRKNELNDKGELEALATAIKEVYFQDYKTAYTSNWEIDESHFEHII